MRNYLDQNICDMFQATMDEGSSKLQLHLDKTPDGFRMRECRKRYWSDKCALQKCRKSVNYPEDYFHAKPEICASEQSYHSQHFVSKMEWMSCIPHYHQPPVQRLVCFISWNGIHLLHTATFYKHSMPAKVVCRRYRISIWEHLL